MLQLAGKLVNPSFAALEFFLLHKMFVFCTQVVRTQLQYAGTKKKHTFDWFFSQVPNRSILSSTALK